LILLVGCGSTKPAGPMPTSASTTPTATRATTPAPAAARTLGFEGIPLQEGPPLAPAGTTGTASVDGIACGPTEQLAYHVHAHLTVFVRGAPRALPGGIGIPGSMVEETAEGPVAVGGSCIYWLHTHAPDGVIHIESPTRRVYTLGNFFDEWHQPLSRDGVAGAVGAVTALVDGRRWTRDPRGIPLQAHGVVQLDVGTPIVPFQPLSWDQTAL
jgi:hypothetical protein